MPSHEEVDTSRNSVSRSPSKLKAAPSSTFTRKRLAVAEAAMACASSRDEPLQKVP